MTVSKITSPISDNEEIDKINEIIDNLGGGGGGGGSGRNVGELVYSAMPLTDAGLHLLDGSLIQGGGIYDEFVQYVAGLVSSYPSLFTSESTWQSTVSSKGVCGKFVYTAGATWYKWYSQQWGVYFYVQSLNPQYGDPIFYYDGSVFTQSFYVATVTEGSPNDTMTSTDGQAILTRAHGDTTIDIEIQSSVRLPKITGIIEGTTSVSALGDLVAAGLPNITGKVTHVGTLIAQSSTGSGALSYSNNTSNLWEAGAGSGAFYDLNIDASSSNSIYGNSTTVQPQTIKQLVYMVIANSTKTEIESDIDQIATDLNGKADTDLTNLSNTGKIAIAHNSMPSGTYDDLTLGASGTEYTAPADGYYLVNKTSNTSGQFLVIENQTTKMGSELIAVGAYNGLCAWQPVRKGEKVKINYNLGGATSFFRFVYAVGSESEA